MILRLKISFIYSDFFDSIKNCIDEDLFNINKELLKKLYEETLVDIGPFTYNGACLTSYFPRVFSEYYLEDLEYDTKKINIGEILDDSKVEHSKDGSVFRTIIIDCKKGYAKTLNAIGNFDGIIEPEIFDDLEYDNRNSAIDDLLERIDKEANDIFKNIVYNYSNDSINDKKQQYEIAHDALMTTNLYVLHKAHIIVEIDNTSNKESNRFDSSKKTIDGIYYKIEKDVVTIIKGREKYSSNRLTIPSTIEGLRVNKIGENAFADNEFIVEVFIPDTISEIDDYAFGNCRNLERIYINHDVNMILGTAFIDNPKLRLCYGEKQTKEMFGFMYNGYIIESCRRNTFDDNWVKDVIKPGGYMFCNHPKCNLLTGMKDYYIHLNKEVIHSKEGFAYYIGEKNEAIIVYGSKETIIKNGSINVPSSIDNHMVKAIGSYAFINLEVLSIIIPDTVEVIAAGAFFNSFFDILWLPKKMKYLNESFTYSDYSIVKDKNERIFAQCIIMPQHIEELDVDLLDSRKRTDYKLIFEKKPSYYEKYTDFDWSIVNTKLYYDSNFGCIYTIVNDMISILSAIRIRNINNLPKTINGLPVSLIYNAYIDELLKTRFTISNDDIKKYEKNSLKMSLIEIILLSKNETIHSVKIPDFIIGIMDCGKVFTFYDNLKIHNRMKYIEGIEICPNMFLPIDIVKIKNVRGILFLKKTSDYPLVEDSEVIIYKYHSKNITDDYFKYAIVEKDDEIVAFAIECLKRNADKYVIHSEVAGYKIQGCNLEFSDNAIIIIDNVYFEENRNDFRIKGWNLKFIVGGSIKKINDLSTFLQGNSKVGFENGIEEINILNKINVESLDLPKSLKKIVIDEDSQINQIKFYNKTEFDRTPFINKAILYCMDSYVSLLTKPYNKEFQHHLLCFEDDFKNHNEEILSRTYEMYNNNRYFVLESDNYITAVFQNYWNESEFVEMKTKLYNNHFECSCTCDIYKRYNVCTHINVLKLYLSRKYSKGDQK